MKAIGTRSPGRLSSLELLEVPEPTPGPGEVRVRVHAAAPNPADLKIVRWEGPARFLHAKVAPLVPGYDLSGVVDAAGEGVTDLAPGDAVFGHLAYAGKTRQGTFAEAVTIGAQKVAKKPPSVDHVTAAASATVGLTALQALRDVGGLAGGGRALVLGASGGVGSLAVGVAKRLGAHVTGVCSTYAVEFVESLGADVVIDRRTTDPLAHSGPFDVVFDTTGLYTARAAKGVLARAGTFVTTLPSLGFVLDTLALFVSPRRARVVVVDSRRADLELLGGWIEDGLRVPLAERHPVTAAQTALEHLAAGGLLGKIGIEVAF